MQDPGYHVAQVNIARALAPLDSPQLADFVALLDEINTLAERSPGFVWRLTTEGGASSSYLQVYEDQSILINMSVWRSIDDLKAFVYRSAHAPVMRRRRDWFAPFAGAYQALWWVRAGHLPTPFEAKARLEHLRAHGPSAYAFTFKQPVAPEARAAEPWPGDAGLCPT
jgi:hypothetical protein